MAVEMSSPVIDDSDIAAVVEVLRSQRLALGPKTVEFERALADYTGRAHGIAVSSGTAGLHTAVVALGIGDGDEVVTTPFSFIPTANCFVFERAVPILVDIEEMTLGPDPELVRGAITDRTKALVVADLFYQPADMNPLREITDGHGLALVEDACEALGAEYRGRPAGSLGDVAVFGFYPNKQITTGEGGMIVTDDDDIAARCRSLRNQGRDVFDTWLEHSRIGYNYRLDEMSAALGVSQLARLDSLMAAREAAATAYHHRLASMDEITPPKVAPTTTKASWFVYTVLLDDGIDRDAVMKNLAERGIPSRAYFPCIHLQRPYRERFGFRSGQFPRAERFSRRALTLPLHPRMTTEDVDTVCTALAAALIDVR